MIFTFNLPLKKIIKNALYFVILGVKRNLAGVFFTLLVVGLNVLIFYLYVPLGSIFPFIITIALVDFIGVYCAYPNIDKYMVDHSKDDESEQTIVESAK